MLYYDRTDLNKGIALANSNNSKECTVCHYWFFNHGFKYHNSVCNDCHILLMLFVNISDNVVKEDDHCCSIHDISKSEAIHLLENFVCDDCGFT